VLKAGVGGRAATRPRPLCFSPLVEVGWILIDFGFTPETLNYNLKLLGIDCGALDHSLVAIVPGEAKRHAA